MASLLTKKTHHIEQALLVIIKMQRQKTTAKGHSCVGVNSSYSKANLVTQTINRNRHPKLFFKKITPLRLSFFRFYSSWKAVMTKKQEATKTTYCSRGIHAMSEKKKRSCDGEINSGTSTLICMSCMRA